MVQQFDVEEIIDSRIFHRKLQFKVKWLGYGYEDISWEPAEGVNAPAKIREFYRNHPDAPKLIRAMFTTSPADLATSWQSSAA